MNATAHNRILRGAFAALSPDDQAAFASHDSLLDVAGNYPDLFDDPHRPDAQKREIDPEWDRFCRFPAYLEGPCLHQWPYPIAEQFAFQPIIIHWMSEAIEAWRSGDVASFVKFIGCLSHHEGDVTQPAHVLGATDGLKLLEELVPAPAHRADFNYHMDLESVTGECGSLRPPSLLGTRVPEASWRLSALNAQAVHEMRRYIVPTLQAIFSDQPQEAIRLAGPPVTRAAQLTADLLYTTLRLAREDISEAEKAPLVCLDLRTWPAEEESHDLVYGARAILDGNCRIPPYPGPVVPARLRFAEGERTVQGLGMLPHSGLGGPREAWMRWHIPAGVFEHFHAVVGLHSELGVGGAVQFSIELDNTEVWNSGKRMIQNPVQEIFLPLHQASLLTLRVSDANEGRSFWQNHAFWASPTLLKANDIS